MEDSESDILIVTQTFQAFLVNVNVITEGEKALRACADGNFRPDLLILDLNTPKVHRFDMLEVANRLRWECCFQFFIESRGHAALVRVGGAKAPYKPISMDEFRQQVTQIVRKRQHAIW